MDKNEMRKNAIYIIEHKGKCNTIDCNICPCSGEVKGNCMAVRYACGNADLSRKEALIICAEWLEENKEEQTMEQINKAQAMKELEQLKKEFDERTKKLEEIINQKESVV